MADENTRPSMTNQELDDYVLNDTVGNEEMNIRKKDFFFQKRRGKLDLRAISKIDIERIGKQTLSSIHSCVRYMYAHLYTNICPLIHPTHLPSYIYHT